VHGEDRLVWGWVSFRKPLPTEEEGCRDVEEYDNTVTVARSRLVAEAKGASRSSGWSELLSRKIKVLRR
jgi:hypothetical protein